MNTAIKINFTPKLSFSAREKFLNQEIQRNIDILNEKGYITLSHTVKNKNESFATVIFSLQKIISI